MLSQYYMCQQNQALLGMLGTTLLGEVAPPIFSQRCAAWLLNKLPIKGSHVLFHFVSSFKEYRRR